MTARDERIMDAVDAGPEGLARLTDASERAEAERLLVIESGLRDVYAPPTGAPALPEPARRTPPKVRTRLAAAILLSVTVGVTWIATRPAAIPPDPVDLAVLHAAFVLDPEPVTVCDTDEKFIAYTVEHLGAPLGASFDSPVTLVGWRGAGAAYGGSKDDQPRVLLARDGVGQEIVVLFQHDDRPRPILQPSSGLRIHERRFGDLRAWEVGHADTPLVLPLLRIDP